MEHLKIEEHPKIDEKDKKILYHLLTNARQPNSVLAKKLRLSREVVDYRIKRLEKLGIIKKYVTLVNTNALGFEDYYICLETRNTTPEREKEIIDFLKSHDFCKWIAICTGRFDIVFTVAAKNRYHFDEIMTEISTFLGRKNLRNYETLGKLKQFKTSSLILSDEDPFEIRPKKEPKKEIKLDKIDMKILSNISGNARANVVDISKKVGLTPEAVSYRLKKMKKCDTIRDFKAMVDLTKLGYWWHILFLKSRAITNEQEKRLTAFFKMNKNIFYAEKLIGRWDLKIELLAKDQFEFKRILDEIKNFASNIIKSYHLCIVFEDVHQVSFTRGMAKVLT
ncbi:Lrp/AsnC family transcriptional regulator [Candidatus Woesearchaeota archaeon]|nr:Lrp/AsnC family transcriptional regulator [Candidatus Woesearchaeota archaeon]